MIIMIMICFLFLVVVCMEEGTSHWLCDQVLQGLLAHERGRQENELELIASENYVSPAVMQAMANVFTNKYSEGYPWKRYYGGQVWVDQLELLTQWRALRMFGLAPLVSLEEELEQPLSPQFLDQFPWMVNVQPLSGGPANAAVFLWCLKPGDRIMGMSLDAGGHLSHGHPLNISGQYYDIIAYGVDQQTFALDYDAIASMALSQKPALIIAWFSAYTHKIDRERFAQIADRVEEEHGYRPLLMADIAHVAWLIAGWVYPSPFLYMDIVTTTTHKTLRWPRWWLIFARQSLAKQINRGVFPWLQWWPHQHVLVAKAQAFGEILYGPSFGAYTQRVLDNARALHARLRHHGWRLIGESTDTHIVLMDVTERHGLQTGLTGKIMEERLEQIGLSINKNMLPFDTRSPMDPSGIRVWTPAVTTRGLGVTEMVWLADCITRVWEILPEQRSNLKDDLYQDVVTYCQRFPLPYTI
jgi:glycine hydroxymethyltransferase